MPDPRRGDHQPVLRAVALVEPPLRLDVRVGLVAGAGVVKHVVFGIHDFSKAMGIQITPRNWTEELKFYLHDILFEARIAGKGVIGGVETLIGNATMPEEFVEPVETMAEAALALCTGTPDTLTGRIAYSRALLDELGIEPPAPG